jgi:catechol 2,3-dioxygenase-like lactoylglutathione lyase family enzyme
MGAPLAHARRNETQQAFGSRESRRMTVIKGVHTMFYSSEPEALRAFLRDKLGFPYTDVGEGWLIFDLPEADMGCHPAGDTSEDGAPSGTHSISFYCDDLAKTITELEARGVEFSGGVEDAGFGLVTFFQMPGNIRVQLSGKGLARC